MTVQHPLTLASPPTGEHFEFRRSFHTDGAFEFLWTLAPKKRGPGMHIHPTETETFRVVSGTLRIWIAGVARDFGPGECVAIPPGVPHRFLNPGDTPAVALVSLDGPAMEDAFVPMAVHFAGRARPTFREFLRMIAHLGQNDSSRPTSRLVALIGRAIVGLARLLGGRPFPEVRDWSPAVVAKAA